MGDIQPSKNVQQLVSQLGQRRVYRSFHLHPGDGTEEGFVIIKATTEPEPCARHVVKLMNDGLDLRGTDIVFVWDQERKNENLQALKVLAYITWHLSTLGEPVTFEIEDAMGMEDDGNASMVRTAKLRRMKGVKWPQNEEAHLV